MIENIEALHFINELEKNKKISKENASILRERLKTKLTSPLNGFIDDISSKEISAITNRRNALAREQLNLYNLDIFSSDNILTSRQYFYLKSGKRELTEEEVNKILKFCNLE